MTKYSTELKKMDASKFVLIGLVLTICAVIFQLIGLASPYWMFLESGGNKIFIGIWKSCGYTQLTDTTTCVDWVVVQDWLKAVRATSILGFLSLLFALVMIILKMFLMKDRKPILLAGIGTAFVGALFILISIAVFASKVDDLITGTVLDYHFAFAFCIIAMLAALGAGAIMMVDVVKS